MSPARTFTKTIVRSLALAALCISGAADAENETKHSADPQTGIETWEIEGQHVRLSLTQVTPDQVRAFYLARGFSREDVERIASVCVFETVFRNVSSPDAISFDLSDWRIVAGKRIEPLKLEKQWQEEWEAHKVPPASRIAFRYALYPTSQSFEPGDWNQGMTTFDLPLGSTFDLVFKWKSSGGKQYEATLRGVQCATTAKDHAAG